ncbi:PKD domain-containing protein [Candidatus Peregrinibacteria bacterium]|jgi:PKD repeat protein|nr:PKD domain-containing protein [Candidatus Peregrinibacteria bacterium]
MTEENTNQVPEIKPVQPTVPRTENISPAAPAREPLPSTAQVGNITMSEKKGHDSDLPKAVAATQPQPVQPQVQPAPQVSAQPAPAAPNKQKLIAKKKKAAQSKKIFILVSLFVVGLLVLFLMAFFLIYSVTDPENNPFIQLFGLEVEQWIPFLINLVSVFFGLLVIASFFIGLIGIFKVGMAPKDNAMQRKKGIAMTMLGSMMLIIFIVTWMFTYVWLDAKRGEYTSLTPVEYIDTIPELVTGLTAPMVIRFSAESVDMAVNPREKEILSYLWHFGDGDRQTGREVSHEYLQKGEVDGSYNVALTVRYKDVKTGEEGVQDFYRTIVFDNEKVFAAFTASEESGPYPLDVTFNASESNDPDGAIIEYLWDFDGDGNFDDGAGKEVNYTFSQVGEYDVELKVVDNSNDYAITERTIKVLESLEPRAVINVDDDEGHFYVNKEYLFDASGSTSPSGAVTKYYWDIGDGTTATTRTFSHTFARTGMYTIFLEVEDLEKRTSQSSVEVEVKAPDSPPRAVIAPTPGYADTQGTYIEGVSPLSISFSAAESSDPDDDIIDYNWDFDGDGNMDGSGEVISHTYAVPGEYNTMLLITDAAGNQTSRSIQVKVDPQGLKARMSASKIEGEVPLVVTFDASSSSYPDGRIISYKWGFGDGSATRFDDSKISYEYNTVGEFTATVEVKADDGSLDEADVLVNVRPVSIRGCFTPSKSVGEVPLTVVFDTSCSTGTVTKYSWKIDGVTVVSSPPHKLTKTFDDPGTYEVEMTVKDHQGVVDTYVDEIMVEEVEE